MVSSEAFSLIREAVSEACLCRRASLSSSLFERGCNRLVLPFLGNSSYASVITGQPMNFRLQECKVPFVGIVLPVPLQMPCHISCSPYQELQVFRDLWLVLPGDQMLKAFPSNLGHQRYAVSVAEDLTYDARRISFFGELENQILNL